MEIVPYTTSGNIKEMCNFMNTRNVQEYGISVNLLENTLNAAFLPVVCSTKRRRMELQYTSYIHLHNFVWYSWLNKGHILSKILVGYLLRKF